MSKSRSKPGLAERWEAFAGRWPSWGCVLGFGSTWAVRRAVQGLALSAMLRALAVALALAPAVASADAGFGISSFSTSSSSTQAGAHANVRTSFTLNTTSEGEPLDQVKDVEVDLPPGLLGDPRSVPRCSAFDFASIQCLPSAQVGILEPTFFLPGREGNPPEIVSGRLPIFNVTPEPGHVATFKVFVLLFGIVINVDVRPDGSYALTAKIHDLSTLVPTSATTLVLWGVPADPSHDQERTGEFGVGGAKPAGVPPTPFMTNPTDCSGAPLSSTLRVDSWQNPGRFATATATQPAPTGCNLLRVSPALTVTPETTRKDSPSGYDVDLRIPQNEDPYGVGTPFMKSVSFTLPAGTSLSPASAGGLEACTDGRFETGGCPNGSRIGSTSIVSPLLGEALTGSIYLGAPTQSDTYRIFLTASGGNISLSLVGHVRADPATGQLTTVFERTPQQPFSDIHLHFDGGPGAALVNPSSCGPANTTARADFYGGVSASASSAFVVDADGQGGACPASAPFDPSFSAGTTSPLAGGFSPLSLTVQRGDGRQPLSTIAAQLPPGLLGLLARVPVCPEPQAAQGTCPQSALIGGTTVAAGAGAQPLYLSGSVYLTGPYEGAPYGTAIVVPLMAGPFNLGTLVVRTRILVDPNDLHLTIASDAIPRIVGGIPLRVRAVNLTIDRQGFMFNPTDCTRRTIAATLGSSEGASVAAAIPFQAAGCPGLRFGPKLSASSEAKASSRGNGASLDVKVAFPPGVHANIKAVDVVLPKHLLSRLSTIQQACPAARYEANPASCPAGSRVGGGAVETPLLGSLLTGPIYLVSHGRAAFPDLRMVLQSQGISLNLNGTLKLSSDGTITSSFASLPDVPFSSFELNLPRGPHSALAANASLCAEGLGAPYEIKGQNGAVVRHAARLKVVGCPRIVHLNTHAKSGKLTKRL